MYLYFLLLFIPVMLLSGWASAKVTRTFNKYDSLPNRSCMTGYDTAVRLMRNRGVTDISVNRVEGKLTDHYAPTKKQVNLSQATYGSSSVAAVGVAAHEIGHVMQKQKGYLPYKIRTALVPITNIGSRLALPLVIIGIILDLVAHIDSPIGQYAVYLGIALYGLSTLFTLVTLPVELNASKRAKKMLLEDGILGADEVKGVSEVLSAAALTYVASLLFSLLYLLRFAAIALSFVRRD